MTIMCRSPCPSQFQSVYMGLRLNVPGEYNVFRDTGSLTHCYLSFSFCGSVQLSVSIGYLLSFFEKKGR